MHFIKISLSISFQFHTALIFLSDNFITVFLMFQRSLLSSMSSCGFHQIPSGKSEFHGISMESIWLEPQPFGFSFPWKFPLFPKSSNGNGQNPRASRNDSQWNPWDSIGILLKFSWNSMGNHIIVIIKNSTTIKN